MKIQYKNEIIKESQESKVILSHNGSHIGTIWGIAHKGETEFDQERSIIYIRQNGIMIATIWDTEIKS